MNCPLDDPCYDDMEVMPCDDNCVFEDLPEREKTREHLLHHIKTDIPTILDYKHIDLFPSRNNFLDKKLSSSVSATIAAGKPILFMPNSVAERLLFNKGSEAESVFYLFGVLMCGSKCCVILKNLDIYFDVRVPARMDPKKCQSTVHFIAEDAEIRNIRTEIFYLRPFAGFAKMPSAYVRVHMKNIASRATLLKLIRTKSYNVNGVEGTYETASDDLGWSNYYFAKLARECRFKTAGWNKISDYTINNSMSSCTYTLMCDVKNFVRVKKARLEELSKMPGALGESIERDPLMTASWDIETYSPHNTGSVPTPDDNYIIFVIGVGYFMHTKIKPLVSVGITNMKTSRGVHTGVIIRCDTEKDIIAAHLHILGKMRPDITHAFNGGNFDWPLLRKKIRDYDLLQELDNSLSSISRSRSAKKSLPAHLDDIYKYSFREISIKINAETQHQLACVAQFPGCIDVDTMPVFHKLHPRAEVPRRASLNFFLAMDKLESKEDMPYKRMFRIYERNREFAEAQPDTLRCHCENVVRDTCKICAKIVKELDYKPIKDPGFIHSSAYSTELHDDMVPAKCCVCSKFQRNLDDARDVVDYCYIDCLRPHQLCVKRAIINDRRELSNMAFVHLADSFYRADGMKVRNVLNAYGNKLGIAISNITTTHSKDHYPGAYVFPPQRGLNQTRPIVGMDFTSLYPSLKLTYNFSPEMVVHTREEAEQLISEGYDLHHVKRFRYEKGEKKGASTNTIHFAEGWVVRHNGAPIGAKNVVSHYKHSIKFLNANNELVGETPIAYSNDESSALLDNMPDHETSNVKLEPVQGREVLPGEQMGLFPTVVQKILAKRKPIKNKFVDLEKRLEVLKLRLNDMNDDPSAKAKLEEEFADMSFMKAATNAKQQALKVIANTFYGESGNNLSPLYELIVAAGITCAGQQNIKFVAEYVKSLGYSISYGDTDSLYISSPNAIFAEIDAEYLPKLELLDKTSKEWVDMRCEYWAKMVALTMQDMNKLKLKIGWHLMCDNKTPYLNMAYEEAGFPTVFCGKKKYYMMPHIATINFYNPQPFIKGIEIIKQGQAKITKKLGEEFIADSLNPANTRTLLELAEDKIRRFYEMATDKNVDIGLFALSAKYKSNKKNIPVQTFIRRLDNILATIPDVADPRRALYERPEEGDRFHYVVVTHEQDYDPFGRMVETKKGDKMEFIGVYLDSQARENPMTIDIEYYLKGMVIGVLARFIACEAIFQPPPDQVFDLEDIESYKKMDATCVKNAVKYLEDLSDKISGMVRGKARETGKIYRSTYKKISKCLTANVAEKYGDTFFDFVAANMSSATVAEPTDIPMQVKIMAESALSATNVGKHFVTQVGQIAQNYPNMYEKTDLYHDHKKLCENKGLNPFQVVNAIKGTTRNRPYVALVIERKRRALESELEKLAPRIVAFAQKYQDELTALVKNIRNGVNGTDADDDYIASKLASGLNVDPDDVAAVNRCIEITQSMCMLSTIEKTQKMRLDSLATNTSNSNQQNESCAAESAKNISQRTDVIDFDRMVTITRDIDANSHAEETAMRLRKKADEPVVWK